MKLTREDIEKYGTAEEKKFLKEVGVFKRIGNKAWDIWDTHIATPIAHLQMDRETAKNQKFEIGDWQFDVLDVDTGKKLRSFQGNFDEVKNKTDEFISNTNEDSASFTIKISKDGKYLSHVDGEDLNDLTALMYVK